MWAQVQGTPQKRLTSIGSYSTTPLYDLHPTSFATSKSHKSASRHTFQGSYTRLNTTAEAPVSTIRSSKRTALHSPFRTMSRLSCVLVSLLASELSAWWSQYLAAPPSAHPSSSSGTWRYTGMMGLPVCTAACSAGLSSVRRSCGRAEHQCVCNIDANACACASECLRVRVQVKIL